MARLNVPAPGKQRHVINHTFKGNLPMKLNDLPEDAGPHARLEARVQCLEHQLTISQAAIVASTTLSAKRGQRLTEFAQATNGAVELMSAERHPDRPMDPELRKMLDLWVGAIMAADIEPVSQTNHDELGRSLVKAFKP
jgi:hypothetical protein